MSHFEQPLLIMLLGSPGSGKSYFARAAADKLNAVRINGDSMRSAIFGSQEEIAKIYNSGDRTKLNDYVFDGLDYVTEQILARGYDVVYDANHNTRIDRENLESIARKHGAKALVVWIKTPIEVAVQRGQAREDSADQRQLSEEMMRETIARNQAITDEPTSEEIVITIDGQIPFEEQFASFQVQLGVTDDK